MHAFLSDLANRQTDRQTNKQTNMGKNIYLLQRVLDSAARLITATGKFDRGLSQLLHGDLHWLDVPQRVQYKLAVMVHRCLGRRAPSDSLASFKTRLKTHLFDTVNP